ncbi:hypothetical protein LFZ50_01985 [Salmonella enterica subsp. arizonae serovar 53:-:- str. SA20100345]|nr:hypothetical protein LFZ50_01985 [Salmonella enterica subsp. arizonae serovar 53:-:- str. SA20100345]
MNHLTAPGNPGRVVIHGYHVRGIDGGISHYATLNLSSACITEMGVVVVKITLTIEYFSNYARGERNVGKGATGKSHAQSRTLRGKIG